MTVGQFILVAVTFALIGITYFFGPLTSSKMQEVSDVEIELASTEFDYEVYRKNALAQLPEDMIVVYEGLRNSYESARNIEEKAAYYKTIFTMLKEYEPVVSAMYLKERAELEESADTWVIAGDEILEAYYIRGANPGLGSFLLDNATTCYEEALALAPEDMEVKIKLASVYMDGTSQVMKGVSILLEIIENEPDNVSANLILGRYGIISGQFDKAVKRLETVLQQDSTIAEAYFYLAEAYNGLGNKARAIELFEQCKRLVSNPEFAREIDQYIEKLKNS